jgi:hypothetical protein
MFESDRFATALTSPGDNMLQPVNIGARAGLIRTCPACLQKQ